MVEELRFDSGVECYGNKAVNEIRRDCLGANKLLWLLAKVSRREKEKERKRIPCSFAFTPVVISGQALMIYR